MNWKKILVEMVTVSAVIGAFWHIWYLVAGEIPAVSQLIIYSEENSRIVWSLPFAISHSWSVIVAPLFILVFSWLVSHAKTEDAGAGLSYGVSAGVIIGLVTGITGLLLGAILIVISIPFGYYGRTWFSAGAGVAFGFTYGLFWTMPIGLVAGAAVALPSLTFFLLTLGIRSALSNAPEGPCPASV